LNFFLRTHEALLVLCLGFILLKWMRGRREREEGGERGEREGGREGGRRVNTLKRQSSKVGIPKNGI
jgi:hypothetical protein